METLAGHYDQWGAVLFFILLYGGILFFLPYYRKMEDKPKGAFLAFVIAFAIEMHGIPFSMYLISWVIGKQLPEGILWGHTLVHSVGYLGMWINVLFGLSGLALIISGWRTIYKHYWSHEGGEGKLVTSGVYRYIRHPQYTGLLLISLGMIFEWATLTLLLLFPVMVVRYVTLALREEQQMLAEFGEDYRTYMVRTKRFLPFLI